MLKQNILYVTNKLQPTPSGGRAMLSKLNFDTICAINGGKTFLFETQREKHATSGVQKLRGYIDGVCAHAIAQLRHEINRLNIERLVVDGSNLGALLPGVRKHGSAPEVITFFHNVEAKFFYDSFRYEKTFRSACVAIANYTAERAAARCSSKIVTLTRDDEQAVQLLYARGGDVFPMCIVDSYDAARATDSDVPLDPYLLFVGGAFYGNIQGIAWFAEHVAPHLGAKTVVVGNGMEGLAKRIGRSSNVTVVGSVDDLNSWYAGCSAVIAPIFSGSGMKTKVAEALMHGKPVIGTRRAFAGYEVVPKSGGKICTSADDFITACSEAVPRGFDPDLRGIYERHFSPDSAERYWRAILGDANENRPRVRPREAQQ